MSSLIGELAEQLTVAINGTKTLYLNDIASTEEDMYGKIIDTVNQTETRMNKIVNAVTASNSLSNASFCSGFFRDSMEQFRSRLSKRITNCTIQAAAAVDSIEGETWSDVTNLESDIMSCHAISLSQCASEGGSDTCYDFFLSNLALAADNMKRMFSLMEAHFSNKLTGFRLPCRNVVDFELIYYPNAVVKALSSCIQNELKLHIPVVCNNSVD